MYLLCDSVSGANWRPTRFADELTVLRYSCSLCHLIPSTTALLPCSHILCEQCMMGCVVQDGGSVCPLDTQPFCEDECQKIKLPEKTKGNWKAYCWNEADGCQFVGTIKAVLLHYDRECVFHAVQCPCCERRILRTEIAAHYVTGCSQNASCASGAQPNGQDGTPTRCYESEITLERSSILQGEMDELSKTSGSTLPRDISCAVSGFEDSCLRGMRSMEANICTTVARQLNAGLNELKTLIRDTASDHLSLVQSQMNKIVEESKQRDASQLQDVERLLRDSDRTLKENVKTQLHEVARALRDTESEFKEHVNSVEANLPSKLADQQQSLRTDINSLQQTVQSTNTESPLAKGSSGNDGDIPWRTEKRLILRKLELLTTESLIALECLSQHIFRRDEIPWVSTIKELKRTCEISGKDTGPLCFFLVIEGAEKMLKLEKKIIKSSNHWYHSDVHMKITFGVLRNGPPMFFVYVECTNSTENSGFHFTKVEVTVQRRSGGGFLHFDATEQGVCENCSKKNISHFGAFFGVNVKELPVDDIIKKGKLKLKFHFQK